MNGKSIGMLGYGAIGRMVAARLRESGRSLRCILTRSEVPAAQRTEAGAECAFVNSSADLLAARPSFIVECAGHQAVASVGPQVLEAGIDLGIVSAGALADAAVERRLTEAARKGGSRIHVAAGAIGGVDALAAAREQGLESVRYRSRKPPRAWRGTAAERLLDLEKVLGPVVFDRGDARRIASAYPQNANVVATISLAAGGFERVEVELVADPGVEGNVHELEVKGSFGEMQVRMRGIPMPGNPKTSTLAALSVLRMLRARDATLVL